MQDTILTLFKGVTVCKENTQEILGFCDIPIYFLRGGRLFVFNKVFCKELYFQHSNEKATLDIYSAKSSRPILDREYWRNAEVGRRTAQNWFPQLARLEMNKGPQEGEEFFKQGRMLKAERKLKTNIGLIDPKSWILFSPSHWFVFSKGTLSHQQILISTLVKITYLAKLDLGYFDIQNHC